MSEPLLLGVKDAARVAGIGRDSFYRLVNDGRIRSVAVAGRRLVPRSEIEAWIARELGGDAMPDTTPGDGRAPVRSVD